MLLVGGSAIRASSSTLVVNSLIIVSAIKASERNGMKPQLIDDPIKGFRQRDQNLLIEKYFDLICRACRAPCTKTTEFAYKIFRKAFYTRNSNAEEVETVRARV